MDDDNNEISRYMISEYTYHVRVWVRASEIKGGSEGGLKSSASASGSLNAADRARAERECVWTLLCSV